MVDMKEAKMTQKQLTVHFFQHNLLVLAFVDK